MDDRLTGLMRSIASDAQLIKEWAESGFGISGDLDVEKVVDLLGIAQTLATIVADFNLEKGE